MAKEPENDLAQLFAAALESEETRHGRPKATPAPGTKGPPTRGGVPKEPAGPSAATSPPRARAEASGDSGASTSGTTRPLAPSRSLDAPRAAPPAAPKATTSAKVATVKPASVPPSSSKSTLTTAPSTLAPSSLPPTSLAPSGITSRPGPAGATMPGLLSPSPQQGTGSMPTLSPAAARAATTALPSSAAPSLSSARPQAPASRVIEPDGLTAIPRSEAMTLDRVAQYKPPAARGSAPAAPASPSPASPASSGPIAPSTRPPARLSMPPVDAPRPSLPPTQRSKTAEIRGRPADELSIDTAAEQLDHKGRSRPIFAPRTPRPQVKRLHPAVELLAGLFPGARLMARERVAAGLAYAIVGGLALLPALLVLLGWSERTTSVQKLSLTPAWTALHAGVLVASVVLFELVRCLSALDPSRRHVRVSRTLAALGLPAMVVVLGGPSVVAALPEVVEPVWLLAVPLVLMAGVATVDVLTRPEASASHRPALVASAAVLASVLVVALVLVVSMDTRGGLVRRATEAGFTRLPELLRALSVGV